MKIHGVEIPEQVILDVEARMGSGEKFKSSDLAAVADRSLEDRGLHLDWVSFASEIANRLIQKHRKAGTIERFVWGWRAVKP